MAKKKIKVEEAEKIDENQAQEGTVEEKESVDLGIDREKMTDDEYINAMEELLGKQITTANECKVVAQRLQADFDNYRKRTNALGEEMKYLGQSMVIEKMLSVLDNCELARKYLQDQAALQGFNMMEQQILSALDGFGLKEIETENKDFDAKEMNCVERQKVDKKELDGKVLECQSKGYTLNGKLLRAATVKVGYIEQKAE